MGILSGKAQVKDLLDEVDDLLGEKQHADVGTVGLVDADPSGEVDEQHAGGHHGGVDPVHGQPTAPVYPLGEDVHAGEDAEPSESPAASVAEGDQHDHGADAPASTEEHHGGGVPDSIGDTPPTTQGSGILGAQVLHPADSTNDPAADVAGAAGGGDGEPEGADAPGPVSHRRLGGSGAYSDEFSVGEIADAASVRNFAMKVTLRTRRWQGQALDTSAVSDVKAARAAKGNVGTFRKNLLAGADSSLKQVHKTIDAARGDHYKMTLPWSVHSGADPVRRQGPRLLANASYFDYCAKMGEHRKQVTQALDEFCNDYADCRAKAQENLGGLYDASQYPSEAEIRRQFSIDFDFEPLPDDITLRNSTLDKVQAEKLVKLVNERTKQMLENAMLDVWNRAYDVVSHMAERLGDPNKLFHNTLISNASEVVDLLKHTNFTNDPRLDELRRELEGRLLLHDPKDLRKNPEQRKEAAREANDILSKLKSYGLGES